MASTSLLNEAPKFDENPFVKPAVSVVEEKTVIKQKYGHRTDQKGVSAVVDTMTGELYTTSFLRRVEVDEDKFAKIYLDNLSMLNDLTTAGIRVFTYFLSIIKPNNAEVLFRIEDCMRHCKYRSKVSVYKGLAELVDANMIARGWADNLYFINPLIFFNGNRVVFATEYIRKENNLSDKPKTLRGVRKELSKKSKTDQGTLTHELFPEEYSGEEEGD